MPTEKVSELDQITTLANTDLLLVSQDQGAGNFVSKSVPYQILNKIENNLFDNPDFNISQFHGSTVNFNVTGATGTEAHLVDRWKVKLYNANGINVQRVGYATRPLTGSSSPYQMRFATGATTNDVKDFSLMQRFTSDQVAKIQDAMTLKFNLRCAYVSGSNVQWSAIYSTPSSFNDFTTTITAQRTTTLTSTAIADSTWTAYTDSFSGLKSFSNIANGLQVEIRITTLSNNSNYEACIADVMFNSGSSAATFVNPTIAESLTRCMYFYWKSLPQATAVANNAGQTGALVARSEYSGADINSLATTVSIGLMFGSPTAAFYNPRAGTAGQWCYWNSDTVTGISGSTFSAFTTDHIVITGGSGTAAVASYGIHLTLDSRL